ncbi:50S ribosomal protein L19e [Candidatus Alkanophaga liquidiphilum]|nr:Ribosomal protein L19E [Candidatus Alkanophaga liquidiphilum]RLG37939.1 MAG: 50S ribosomal protein L19e [Candidatus Alkanophagales archaeon]
MPSLQRRLAAEILKVGVHRVWMNPEPEAMERIAEAVTRDDVRALIEEGLIKRRPERGVSRGRARLREQKRRLGRRRGHGSRKGAKGARMPKKRLWIIRIRALRRRLRELRDSGKIDRKTYRMLYRKAKGGEFKSVAHLNTYIKANFKIELDTE